MRSIRDTLSVVNDSILEFATLMKLISVGTCEITYIFPWFLVCLFLRQGTISRPWCICKRRLRWYRGGWVWGGWNYWFARHHFVHSWIMSSILVWWRLRYLIFQNSVTYLILKSNSQLEFIYLRMMCSVSQYARLPPKQLIVTGRVVSLPNSATPPLSLCVYVLFSYIGPSRAGRSQ